MRSVTEKTANQILPTCHVQDPLKLNFGQDQVQGMSKYSSDGGTTQFWFGWILNMAMTKNLQRYNLHNTLEQSEYVLNG